MRTFINIPKSLFNITNTSFFQWHEESFHQHTKQIDKGQVYISQTMKSGTQAHQANFIHSNIANLISGEYKDFIYGTGSNIEKNIINVKESSLGFPSTGVNFQGVIVINKDVTYNSHLSVKIKDTPGSGLGRALGNTSGTGYILPPSGFIGWIGGFENSLWTTANENNIITITDHSHSSGNLYQIGVLLSTGTNPIPYSDPNI